MARTVPTASSDNAQLSSRASAVLTAEAGCGMLSKKSFMPLVITALMPNTPPKTTAHKTSMMIMRLLMVLSSGATAGVAVILFNFGAYIGNQCRAYLIKLFAHALFIKRVQCRAPLQAIQQRLDLRQHQSVGIFQVVKVEHN